MADPLAHKIPPRTRVHLRDYPTDGDGGLDKKEGEAQLAPLLEELEELQELMWGAQTHALLAVLQGRDAAGKDGVINHVLNAIDPQGLQVTAFKAPSEEEADHDFLWRIHSAVPRKGVVGVFNRSQYEQVLVVRVHELAPPAQIEAAYDQINHFERLLTETGTVVVKFYLHLSRDEQRERLLAREKEVGKAWKLNLGDWAERPYWDAHTQAYEEAMSRCSTDYAPWYVIPADRKWAAHLAVAQVLVDTLRPYRQGWVDKLTALQKKMLTELAKVDKP
ncbi:MAG TPA: PPK2 family polyphosphate kinase [Chloroflexia bacterium]|nr:PPK2 family polyphosphate kinase [Chloroflexia bacterium]